MAPAQFSGTTLYVGRRHHPEHGLVHVLGYQNTAVNLAAGPNAMLLHLPARSLTSENFLPVDEGQAGVLRRMVEAVRDVPRGLAAPGGMAFGAGAPVQVFEHDVYTVLLADDPTLLPDALAQVPQRKRPRLDRALMDFYAQAYPEHPVAVCCFDNADARRAKPLLLRYTPHDPDLLVAPALDCHTGGVPEPGAPVDVDHWVIFGTDEAPADWGSPVTYAPGMGRELFRCLPERVMGRRYGHHGPLPNGDFAISHQALLAGDLTEVRRVRPDDLATHRPR